MQNHENSRRKQSSKSGFSKKNKSYDSIQEYFSDLGTIATIQSEFNENDFLDFLDIIDYVIKIEKIEFKYNEINNIDEFLQKLFMITNGNSNYYSRIGSYTYDPIKKKVTHYDRKLDKAQSTIFALYIEPFYNLKNKINKELWNYIAVKITKEQSRLEETEFCGTLQDALRDWAIEEYNIVNACKDPKKRDEDAILETKTTLEYINRFISYLKEFDDIKYKYPNEKKLSKDEKKLLKIIDDISSFDYSNGMYFMNQMKLDQEFFERYLEEGMDTSDLDLQHMQHEVCEKCYSGQYFLSMNSDDHFETEYLQWINEAGNNCYWPIEFSNKITYDKNSRKGHHIKIRNKIINHYDNFYLFNELVEKLNNGKKL